MSSKEVCDHMIPKMIKAIRIDQGPWKSHVSIVFLHNWEQISRKTISRFSMTWHTAYLYAARNYLHKFQQNPVLWKRFLDQVKLTQPVETMSSNMTDGCFFHWADLILKIWYDKNNSAYKEWARSVCFNQVKAYI